MKEYLPTSETRGVLVFTCKDEDAKTHIRQRFYAAPFRPRFVSDAATVQRIVQEHAFFLRKVFSAEGLNSLLKNPHSVLAFISQEPNEHYFLNSVQEAVEFLNQSEQPLL